MNPLANARMICLAVWLSSALSLVIYGQEALSPFPVKATENKPSTPRLLVATEVQLLVKVRDSLGEAVTGLQATDFTVFDNGRRQVNVECQPHRTPLQLVLLIDETCHWTERTSQFHHELQTFCRSLSTEDQVAVIQFSNSFLLTRDWFAPKDVPATLFQPPQSRSKQAVLYDALMFAITKLSEAVAPLKAQRTIVLLTSGVTATGLIEATDVLDALQEEEVTLYTYSKTTTPNSIAKISVAQAETYFSLASLTKLSGGRSYFPPPGASLSGMFQSLTRELQTQYALTFLPALAEPNDDDEGELSHEFLVQVRGGHQVLTRAGNTKTKLLP